jgi:hypothetical protein
MSETTGDDANEELRLMTRIDGEAARLLVHIEPIEEEEDSPSETSQPGRPPPPETSGLAE